MKRLFLSMIALVLICFSSLTAAQTKPVEPTPAQIVISMSVALIAGGVIVTGAALTGNLPALCTRLKGTYNPNSNGVDQCPDGQWRNLVSN